MSELLTSELKDCLENGAGTCRNADMIDKLRAEIERLEAELKITDELLKEATETIGAVVACCTYNSGLKGRQLSLKFRSENGIQS